MDKLYALFFGAGAATFIYTKMGRRVGFTNTENLTIIVVVAFIITTIFFYTILHYIINI